MQIVWRWAECGVLYGAIPVMLIFTEDIFPIIPTILVLTGAVVVALRRGGWSYQALWRLGPARAWRNMLLVWVGSAVVWTGIVWYWFPELFLAFPLERPDIWLMVLLLYPVLSAWPQEILYRTFFWERYGELFGRKPWLLIVASGVAFMWGHLLFMNPFAIGVTLLGGVVFAWRYHHTKSVLLVSVEHALYGNLFFTLGLGQFLFSGAV